MQLQPVTSDHEVDDASCAGLNAADVVCVCAFVARQWCRRACMVVLIHGPQQQEYEAPPCYLLPCFSSFILELTAWWIFQGHAWSPNPEERNWQSIPDADPENFVLCFDMSPSSCAAPAQNQPDGQTKPRWSCYPVPTNKLQPDHPPELLQEY